MVGAQATAREVQFAALASLVAGACSMVMGEYISMAYNNSEIAEINDGLVTKVSLIPAYSVLIEAGGNYIPLVTH